VPIRFNHTNIVTPDPDQLAAFYIEVFGCVRLSPDRNLAGEWLERGTGIPGAKIHAIHLRLPGHGDNGPTLEVYSFEDMEGPDGRALNRPGLMHIAFDVEEVNEVLDRLLAAGGQKLGDVVRTEVAGVGTADFVYARDPEGNVVELLSWK
jgi:catechol 2,3-dioxygenase-like lactoylglutathione lyase family enzyme